MSTSGISVNTNTGAPISFSGLASGLDTTAIISALVSAQREPITRLTNEQSNLQGNQQALEGFQTSLQQLSFAAAEFNLPSSFESPQVVTSSEPARVSATASAGAAVGGHEIEVTQLANSSQRSFTFASPTAEDKITIEGSEFTVKAGEKITELADQINADSAGTVYAAPLENGTLVLSSRKTGNTGAEFITVTDTGGTLTEVAGSAKEGRDAEYKLDGVAGSSSTNTVAGAIPGVTLTLEGVTTTGPVTINVQPPGPSATAVEAQIQSFIKLYNSTVTAIEKQITTRPPAKPSTAAEFGTGTLFEDSELTGLLDTMRQTMYEPIEGMAAGMASPADIGISTGSPSGSGGTSQATLEGQLTLEPAKLAEAVRSNPAGVQKMLQAWSTSMQAVLNTASEPGGTLELRSNGDGSQISQLTTQITSMNEQLAEREKALRATYAALEGVISQNTSQSAWLTNQANSLSSSTSATGS